MDKSTAQTFKDTRAALVKARDEMLERASIFTRMLELLDTAEKYESGFPGPVRIQQERRPATRQGPTVRELITETLRNHEGPMHANDVLASLQKRGITLSAKDPKATVVTALIRLARNRMERGEREGVIALGGNRFVWGSDLLGAVDMVPRVS